MKKIILLTTIINSILLFSQAKYRCFKNIENPKLKIEIKEEKDSTFLKFKDSKDYSNLVLINSEVTENMDLVSTFADNEKFDEKTSYVILYKFEDYTRENILIFITFNKRIYNFITDLKLQGNIFSDKPCFE